MGRISTGGGGGVNGIIKRVGCTVEVLSRFGGGGGGGGARGTDPNNVCKLSELGRRRLRRRNKGFTVVVEF